MKRTPAQRRASRKNGKGGGRPKVSPEKRILERIRAQKIIDANTAAAAQFLVHLMEGRVPDTSGSDRRLAAESILDRNLGRAAAASSDVTRVPAGKRETKVIVKTSHAPPEGWVGEDEKPA